MKMLGKSGRAIVLMVLGAVLVAMAVFSPDASAKTIPNAISAVTVVPANPNIFSAVNVTAAWCVPDGSMKGDTFTLTLPTQLIPLTTGFPLKDPASGAVVANAVVANGVVTFTLTDFAQTHNNVCGSAFFSESLDRTKVVANQPTDLTFTSGSKTFKTTITPSQGVGSPRTKPVKFGSWFNKTDQGVTQPTGALIWYMETTLSPAAGFAKVVFTDTATAGQEFNCKNVHALIGTFDANNNFASAGDYKGTVDKVCSPTALTFTTGAVPAGRVIHLTIPVNITDSTLASYSDSGSVATNGSPAQTVTARNVLRNTAGGVGTGNTPTPTPSSASPSPSPSPTTTAQSTTPATTPAAATSTAASTTGSPLAFSSGAAAASTTPAGAALAFTGFHSSATILVGAALILAGAGLQFASRRRKGQHI